MPVWPKKQPRDGVDMYGRSLAWHAAADGDVASIQSHYAAGENLSAGDDTGLTPLHIAAQNGQLEAIQLLLTLGVDTNATDKYGNGSLWTATHYACLASATERNHSIVRILLEGGADPDNKNNSNRSPRDISQRSNQVLQIYSSFGAAGV